jgi:hypothetical protein
MGTTTLGYPGHTVDAVRLTEGQVLPDHEEQIEDVHRGNLEGKKPRDNEIDLRVFHSLIGGGIETRIQGP